MTCTVEEVPITLNERPRIKITSDKFNSGFLVAPSVGGFVFYSVTSTGGSLPKELSGKYTRMDDAVKAVKRYELKHKGTPQKQRDVKREERNAAKAKRDSTQHVHSGSDNGEG
jgi:hypothetical protein